VSSRDVLIFFCLDRENKAEHFAACLFFCFSVLPVYLPATNKLMKVIDTDLFLIFSLSLSLYIYDSRKKGENRVEVRRRDHNDLCESLRCASVCVLTYRSRRTRPKAKKKNVDLFFYLLHVYAMQWDVVSICMSMGVKV
jgi:hypothetical protein